MKLLKPLTTTMAANALRRCVCACFALRLAPPHKKKNTQKVTICWCLVRFRPSPLSSLSFLLLLTCHSLLGCFFFKLPTLASLLLVLFLFSLAPAPGGSNSLYPLLPRQLCPLSHHPPRPPLVVYSWLVLCLDAQDPKTPRPQVPSPKPVVIVPILSHPIPSHPGQAQPTLKGDLASSPSSLVCLRSSRHRVSPPCCPPIHSQKSTGPLPNPTGCLHASYHWTQTRQAIRSFCPSFFVPFVSQSVLEIFRFVVRLDALDQGGFFFPSISLAD